MRTYTSPGEVPVEAGDNPISQLLEMADVQPDAAALAYEDGGRFVDVSTREMADTVLARRRAGRSRCGIRRSDRAVQRDPHGVHSPRLRHLGIRLRHRHDL